MILRFFLEMLHLCAPGSSCPIINENLFCISQKHHSAECIVPNGIVPSCKIEDESEVIARVKIIILQTGSIDGYATDGSEEIFTKMHCVCN